MYVNSTFVSIPYETSRGMHLCMSHAATAEIMQVQHGIGSIFIFHQFVFLSSLQLLPGPRAQSGSQQFIFNILEWMTGRHGSRTRWGLDEATESCCNFSHIYIA